jgi:hypothetical protein
MARAGFHEASVRPVRGIGRRGPLVEVGPVARPGTQETSCGDVAARAVNLDVVAVFFFFLLSPIPLAVAEKRNTSGCLHAYLELCGGGAWPRRRGGGIGDRPSGSGSSRRRIGRRRPLRHVRLYVSARATVRACDHSPAGGPVDRSSCIACDAIDFIFPPRIYICLAVASTLLPLGLWAGDGLDRAARTSEHAATGVARVVVMAFPLRWLPACLRCRGQKENACGTAILSYFLTHVN